MCERHSTCDEENLACEMATLTFLHMQFMMEYWESDPCIPSITMLYTKLGQ